MKKNIAVLCLINSIMFTPLAVAKTRDLPIITHNPMLEETTRLLNKSPEMVARYVIPTEEDFLVSSLINANVKNVKNETIGQIKDLVIRGNSVRGVVVSVGGFLGMGAHYIVVDPSTMNIKLIDGTWSVRTDASKEDLKNAPEFKYEGRWGL